VTPEGQPQDVTPPSVAPDGTSAASADSAKATMPRRRRLLLLLGVVLLFFTCVGGAAGVFLYTKATEPDRSNPTVVTREFLDIALVSHESARLDLLLCPRWSKDEAMAEIAKLGGPQFRWTWGVTNVSQTDDQATVTVRVTATQDGHSDVEVWTVALERSSGWRVCGVAQSSLNP
jgi:hypothetical protein